MIEAKPGIDRDGSGNYGDGCSKETRTMTKIRGLYIFHPVERRGRIRSELDSGSQKSTESEK